MNQAHRGGNCEPSAALEQPAPPQSCLHYLVTTALALLLTIALPAELLALTATTRRWPMYLPLSLREVLVAPPMFLQFHYGPWFKIESDIAFRVANLGVQISSLPLAFPAWWRGPLNAVATRSCGSHRRGACEPGFAR